MGPEGQVYTSVDSIAARNCYRMYIPTLFAYFLLHSVKQIQKLSQELKKVQLNDFSVLLMYISGWLYAVCVLIRGVCVSLGVHREE